MKMITAVVRTTCVENITKSLEDIGITELTFYEIKGIGEQAGIFKPYTIHYKIEIIIPDEKVDGVTELILKHAHSGQPGDGVIAVSPVDHMIKIRTKEKM